MAEATERPAPADDVPDLAALLREVDDAAYWSEHLVLAADVVSAGVLECLVPAKATSDGIALTFLLEEAKCATVRLRDAVDGLARHLGVRP
jgi:hypothetical protein